MYSSNEDQIHVYNMSYSTNVVSWKSSDWDKFVKILLYNYFGISFAQHKIRNVIKINFNVFFL